MRKFLYIFWVSIFIGQIQVRAQLAQKGASFISLGYGYPSVLQFMGQVFKLSLTATQDASYPSSFSYKGIGPMHFRYEYMLGGRVGMGLSSNYESGLFTYKYAYADVNSNTVNSTSIFKYSSINALLRCNFHFLKRSEKLDIYYGMGVGYSHTRVKYREEIQGEVLSKSDQTYVDNFNSYLNDVFTAFPVAFEEVFGLRAAFNDNTGMYVEAGYSKAICQLGFYAKIGNSKGFNRSSWKWY